MTGAVSDPVNLTHETYFEFVQKNRYAVIHFWAAWNAHDVLLKRTIPSELSAELWAQVAFARFDVDPPAHQDICRSLDVLNVPFLAFYREGRLVHTVVGLRPPEVMNEYVRDYLKSG